VEEEHEEVQQEEEAPEPTPDKVKEDPPNEVGKWIMVTLFKKIRVGYHISQPYLLCV